MRLYTCQYCSLTLYFENTRCLRCGSALGYWAETDSLCVLDPEPGVPDVWRSWAVPDRRLKRCANAAYDVCNWVIDADAGEETCSACRHNRVVPSLASGAGRSAWQTIESAKHKLYASLHKLGLVRIIDAAGGASSLGFNFLEDPADGRPGVMTGHAGGTITIATEEANDAAREERRNLLGEPYRTVLGHFRHEIGHYFWDRLVRDRNRFDECRAVFGDHTRDYQAAVKRYYAAGAPHAWQDTYVSAYATMHPWEDFAETFAHYLHMVGTLEMAFAYQLQIAARTDRSGSYGIREPVNPYSVEDIDALVAVWMPLTTMLNSLNGAMGKDDAYPFVLSASIIRKLGFIHDLIREAVAEATPPMSELILAS